MKYVLSLFKTPSYLRWLLLKKIVWEKQPLQIVCDNMLLYTVQKGFLKRMRLWPLFDISVLLLDLCQKKTKSTCVMNIYVHTFQCYIIVIYSITVGTYGYMNKNYIYTNTYIYSHIYYLYICILSYSKVLFSHKKKNSIICRITGRMTHQPIRWNKSDE